MDGVPGGEVAEEDLGLVVELVGDDIEVSVPIQIQDGRGAGTGGAADHLNPGFAGAEVVSAIGTVTIHGHVVDLDLAAGAWLHSKEKLGADKPAAAVVQEQAVDCVAERKPHSSGDEKVLITVGIEIPGADPPRPESLGTQLLRALLVVVPAVLKEGISEDIAGGGAGQHVGELGGAPCVALCPLDHGVEPHGQPPLLFGHVRMHVGDKEIHPTIVVVVEELYPHRPPGGARKELGGAGKKPLPSVVEVHLVLPLHVGKIQVGESVLVEVGERAVPGPMGVANTGGG